MYYACAINGWITLCSGGGGGITENQPSIPFITRSRFDIYSVGMVRYDTRRVQNNNGIPNHSSPMGAPLCIFHCPHKGAILSTSPNSLRREHDMDILKSPLLPRHCKRQHTLPRAQDPPHRLLLAAHNQAPHGLQIRPNPVTQHLQGEAVQYVPRAQRSGQLRWLGVRWKGRLP